MPNACTLTAAMAQMAPVWLNKNETLAKIEAFAADAAKRKADLVVFGEALLPGYPFWLANTGGAAWDNPVQKELHAHYLRNAIQIEAGDLNSLCRLAAAKRMAIYLGTVERAHNRGGHSLYCSLVYIDAAGVIQSVHRKLQPTYEERLVWAPGDGHGLRVHPLEPFTVGGLNCWENWMPLSRTALYGQGENLHVAVWPGAERNTRDITRFIALEGRSYVLSVSGLMRREDIPADTPQRELIAGSSPEVMADGGSCIAGPDGRWVIEPQVGEEGIYVAELDLNRVLEERQNFDLAGHYSRPDVTRLMVNRERQSLVDLRDS